MMHVAESQTLNSHNLINSARPQSHPDSAQKPPIPQVRDSRKSSHCDSTPWPSPDAPRLETARMGASCPLSWYTHPLYFPPPHTLGVEKGALRHLEQQTN